jgi:uncharacterized pyridoxal phosphate-containing UPF0001 family protein
MGAVTVSERLAEIRSRIGNDVTVVAVTKGFGPEAAIEARDAGIVDIGENYAQELVAKAHEVDGVRWHFLGHVQRNKVGSLTPYVHLWQGVDRALELPGNVLLQVNLSGLPQRNGCSWEDAPGLVAAMSNVLGLMGVAGPGDPRPQFRRLRALADELGLREVSMGMSGDYDIAADEGATMVRLGTVLFGPRPDRSDLRR